MNISDDNKRGISDDYNRRYEEDDFEFIEKTPEVKKQGYLSWMYEGVTNAFHKVGEYTVFRGVDADKIIEERSARLEVLMKTNEVGHLIRTTLTPRLVNLINEQVPGMVGWKKRMGVNAALALASRDIPKWIEANILTLAVNFAEHMQIEEIDDRDILFTMLEFAAKEANENMDEIQRNIISMDSEIERLTATLKEIEPRLLEIEEGNEKEQLLKEKGCGELRIQELTIHKQELFSVIAEKILEIAYPNGKEDIVLPSPIPGLYYLDFKSIAFHNIKQQLPKLMLDVTTKMMSASKQNVINLEEIEKHHGGAELIGLANLTTHQFHEIVSKVLLDQGNEELNQNAPTYLEELIRDLAKRLGAKSGQQFNQLLRHIGTYCEPVLNHLFANLSKGMKEDDKRHVLTYILETNLEDLFAFAEANSKEIDTEYKKYAMRAEFIHKKYSRNLLGEKLSDEEMKLRDKALEEAFKPLKAIFAIHAKKFIKKAGLNTKGLEKILPLGAGVLSGFLKDAVIDYTFNFYKDVILVQKELVPEKHPLAAKVSHFKESYSALDKIVRGVTPVVKQHLQSPGSGIGELITDFIQNLLLIKKAPTDEKYFEEPIRELCDAPIFEKVENYLQGYIRDTLILMLGNLALSYPNANEEIKLEEASLLHIIKIISENVKDPKLAEKLDAWKKMPEDTPEDIEAKAAQKAHLMKLFDPCIRELSEKTELNKDETLLINQSKKDKLRQLLKKSVLPEVLFKIGCSLVMPNDLPEALEDRWAALKNQDRLENFGRQVCEMIKPELWSNLKDQGYVLANLVNEHTADGALTFSEEVHFGQNLKRLLGNEDMQAQVNPMLHGLLERLIQFGLKNLAVNSSISHEDALTRVLMHIRKRMAEQSISPKLVHKLEKYDKLTEGLNRIEKELSELRQAAIAQFELIQNTEEGEFLSFQNQIKAKEEEYKKAEKEINDARAARSKSDLKTMHAQLANEIAPFTQQIVKEMGFENTLWENLANKILPDLGILAYNELTRSYKMREKHQDNLENKQLIGAAEKYADIALKYGDNWVVAHAEQVTNLVAKAATPTIPKEGMRGMDQIGRNIPSDFEFLLPAAKQEIYGQLLEIFDGFTHNIKKIENDQPEAIVQMTMDIIGMMTEHLGLANQVVKEQGKQHMHEVNPLVMHREFEKKGLLHAALPNSGLLADINIFKEEINKRIEDLEHLPQNEETKVMIARLQNILKAKQAEVDKIAMEHFYKQFSIWLLNMAGKNEAKDLTVHPAFQPKLWELMKDSLLPMALMATSEKIFSPEIMNKSLAALIEKINENLGTASKESPSSAGPVERNRGDKKKIIDFLEQLAQAMPGTYMASMLNWKLIRNMTASQLESVLKASLKNWPLSKIFEEALIAGAENLPQEALGVAPEDFIEEKSAKETVNQKNIDKIEKSANEVVDNSHNSVKEWLAKSWWGVIINKLFGWLLDWIFSRIKTSVDAQAPALRKNLIEVPIHANVLYKGGDFLMKHYVPTV